MKRISLLLLVLLPAVGPAVAREAFPGQNHLAAGLACHRNLDMVCARQRLEQALAAFSPEEDPGYMQHVRTARMTLALIHVADDELGKAEQEFKTLLLLDPGFRLPAGDHPPKVRYVFDRARAAVPASRKPPPVQPEPAGQPPGDEDQERTTLSAGSVSGVHRPTPRAPRCWSVFAEGRWVQLFGDDAQVLGSGPGASAGAGLHLSDIFRIQLGACYAYHPSAADGPALQAMSVEAEGQITCPLGAFGLRLGGGAGVLAMGTEDRYDTWGLVLRASAALVYPARAGWALVAALRPSVVVTGKKGSFYLPVGIGGEVRW